MRELARELKLWLRRRPISRRRLTRNRCSCRSRTRSALRDLHGTSPPPNCSLSKTTVRGSGPVPGNSNVPVWRHHCQDPPGTGYVQCRDLAGEFPGPGAVAIPQQPFRRTDPDRPVRCSENNLPGGGDVVSGGRVDRLVPQTIEPHNAGVRRHPEIARPILGDAQRCQFRFNPAQGQGPGRGARGREDQERGEQPWQEHGGVAEV